MIRSVRSATSSARRPRPRATARRRRRRRPPSARRRSGSGRRRPARPAGDPPAGADDHLAVDLLAQDAVRRADVVVALGRDRRGLDPEAGLAHRGGGLGDDAVVGLAPVLEREVVALELELEAADVGVEHAQRLLEQLLAGLVALEDDDPQRRPSGMRARSRRARARPPAPRARRSRSATCSSKSTPSASAPSRRSSRLTAAAKAGVLSFFLTDFGVSPWMPSGRTYAQAMMKPDSSSTANSVFSIGVSRETPRKSACEATARTSSAGSRAPRARAARCAGGRSRGPGWRS